MGKKIDTRTEMQKFANLDIDSYRGCIPGVADGWFTAKDAEAYIELVSPIKNGMIIEVGSYEGLSLFHIKDICKANNTALMAVDFLKWPKLLENTEKWGIELISLPSIDAAELFPNEHFDLLFLDANHRVGSVSADIKAWLPKIKKDGIFAGHDFNLRRVRRGIRRQFDIEKVSTKATLWWFKNHSNT